MVQQGASSSAKNKDISDIYALGADDASDYGDFITSNTID